MKSGTRPTGVAQLPGEVRGAPASAQAPALAGRKRPVSPTWTRPTFQQAPPSKERSPSAFAFRRRSVRSRRTRSVKTPCGTAIAAAIDKLGAAQATIEIGRAHV